MSVSPLPSSAPEPRSPGLAWKYLTRALKLRCPECGISPVFPPLSHLRGPADLFTPLDGCPRCGYAYEREPGYFLIATWAVSYGLGAMVALAIYLYMEYVLESSLTRMMWTIIPVVLVVNLLFARHARSLWLAIDHFFDPHVGSREGGNGDDGGNVPRPPSPPQAPSTGIPDSTPSAGRRLEEVRAGGASAGRRG